MMIIGANEIAKLRSLQLYADTNRYSHAQLELVREKKAIPIGQRLEYRRFIPQGYTLVFTINELRPEEKTELGGQWERHLSVSWVSGINTMPQLAAVDEAMRYLGFVNKLRDQKFVKIDDCIQVAGFPLPLGSINIQEIIKTIKKTNP